MNGLQAAFEGTAVTIRLKQIQNQLNIAVPQGTIFTDKANKLQEKIEIENIIPVQQRPEQWLKQNKVQ